MHIGGCDYSKWAETTIFVNVEMGGCAYLTGTFVPAQLEATEVKAVFYQWHLSGSSAHLMCADECASGRTQSCRFIVTLSSFHNVLVLTLL